MRFVNTQRFYREYLVLFLAAWTRDFKLQAKTTPFKGFKPVYHYRQIINGGTYASRLSDVDAPKDGFIVRQDPLYLPGKL